MQRTTFVTPAIVCDGCANAIKKAVGRIPGVADVSVDVAAKRVVVSHDDDLLPEVLTAALDRAGFPVAS